MEHLRFFLIERYYIMANTVKEYLDNPNGFDSMIKDTSYITNTGNITVSNNVWGVITNTQKINFNRENIGFKYNEDTILDEVYKYICSTYGGYYGNTVQAQDLIVESGHAEGFYIGNVIKYSSRYGKKDGYNKKDLMKVIHYAILALNNHNLQHEKV